MNAIITDEQLAAWNKASELAKKGLYEEARKLKPEMISSDQNAIERVIERHQRKQAEIR
jgi:hypothetical protein